MISIFSIIKPLFCTQNERLLMNEKASVINIATPSHPGKKREQEVILSSGRSLQVRSKPSDAPEDLLEIREEDGTLTIKLRLTSEGPVLEMEGIRLEMTGAKSIALRAETVEIAAEESATISSRGEISLSSREEFKIDSKKDVRVTGEIIHLN